MKRPKPTRGQLIPLLSTATRLGVVTFNITKRRGAKKRCGKHWSLQCPELWDGPMHVTKEQLFAIFDLALKKKLDKFAKEMETPNHRKMCTQWACTDVSAFFNIPICDEWVDIRYPTD